MFSRFADRSGGRFFKKLEAVPNVAQICAIDDSVGVVHVIAPYLGGSPLRIRQRMFLESVFNAKSRGVRLLAATNGTWSWDGWEIHKLPRTASVLGDASDKPFLRDLFDLALHHSRPDDWLVYSNVDCSLAPDFYRDLRSRRASVVEYQRQDVEGDPRTLEELFSNPRTRYSIGLDAFAIRASLFREVRDALPDFVIGEPHWDTIYSGFFRRLVPVQRDIGRLLHPKHAKAWDLAHPTPAGVHNQQLFVDSLNRGLAEKGMISDVADQTDTAVIVAVFGNDPVRVEANITGLGEQLLQDLYADVYLVELTGNGTGSAYPDQVLGKVRHVAVPASDASDGLFQKEALYNRGWRAALEHHPYEYFIFLDADIYSRQHDWFRRIRARLQEEPRRAVQGWRTVRDTLDQQLLYSSVGAAFVLNQPTDLPLNPGMCWGLHRALLEAGDGFNPYCLDCAGDSAFVAEYLNTSTQQYDPWLYQWGWFREIERALPFHAELDCVPVDLVHVHHGALRERNYDGFRYALDAFPPLRELVRLNGHGVLEWRDGNCAEKRILQHRAHMVSRAAVDELLDRFEYSRYPRPSSSRHQPAAKRPFQWAAHHARRAPAVLRASQPEEEPAGIKIFDPREIFRKDFPFSWCDGVIKQEGSTYAPIQSTAKGGVLILDGKPGTSYVVCALPLQPTWLPIDIRACRELRFEIRVTGGPPDVFVSLVSQSPEEAEIESRLRSLNAHGLKYKRWIQISLPLGPFGGEVDLSRIRLIKFLGCDCFRLELRRIYIR